MQTQSKAWAEGPRTVRVAAVAAVVITVALVAFILFIPPASGPTPGVTSISGSPEVLKVLPADPVGEALHDVLAATNRLHLTELQHAKTLAPKYNAQVEVSLWDGTRVDLLNDEYAIEIDWAPKWKESIGQSLYYALVTNKKPAVLLLVKRGEKDKDHIYRCQTVCAKHGIALFIERIDEQE